MSASLSSFTVDSKPECTFVNSEVQERAWMSAHDACIIRAQMVIGMNPRAVAGNHVIDHGNAEFSLLAHLQRVSLAVTQSARVNAGDLLGKCGNSDNERASSALPSPVREQYVTAQ